MISLSRKPVLRTLRILSIATTLLAANMAPANEAGFISITLVDEQYNLPLSAGHSDWTGTGGFAKVTILTRPSDLQTWHSFQSLRLAFDLFRNSAQTPEMSLLRRTGDAGFERWYGRNDSGGLIVVVTDRNLDGAFLQVGSTFSGTLGQSLDFGQTIDLSAPMPVSGTFEAKLLPIR
ncbi:hypothetical protein [Marivita sp.]|uniref:hypothetical protein n=1 Tax=Marivita sp. TaxID=2003365 RepID=UPI003F6C73C7